MYPLPMFGIQCGHTNVDATSIVEFAILWFHFSSIGAGSGLYSQRNQSHNFQKKKKNSFYVVSVREHYLFNSRRGD
jgi:hypothetical protein